MKKLLIFVILVFIGIQLVPMNVPADLPVKEGDALEAPENVQAILERSCFDCHSSHTVPLVQQYSTCLLVYKGACKRS